jgi:hypothetical protein
VGLKSAGYCDANGHQIGNPGSERMQPYYFPFMNGQGNRLQSYFDYRPTDCCTQVVAKRRAGRILDASTNTGHDGEGADR